MRKIDIRYVRIMAFHIRIFIKDSLTRQEEIWNCVGTALLIHNL